MKSYDEIKTILNCVNNEIKRLNDLKNNINAEIEKIPFIKKLNGSEKEKVNKLFKDKTAVEAEIDRYERIYRVWILNCYYVYLDGLKDGIWALLKKYDGKPLGEKTKAKLKAEAKTLFNINIYIVKECIAFYEANENGYNMGIEFRYYANGNGKFLDDNILQVCDDINYGTKSICQIRYIDNPDFFINEILELENEIEKRKTELCELVKRYNGKSIGKNATMPYIRFYD